MMMALWTSLAQPSPSQKIPRYHPFSELFSAYNPNLHLDKASQRLVMSDV